MLRILEKRPIDSYPEAIKDKIALISYKRSGISYDPSEGTVPIGSSVYRFQRYPGDLDLFEMIIGYSYVNTVNDFITVMQRRVEKILTKPNVWITDIKAGVDERYSLPDIEFKPNQILGNDIIEKLTTMFYLPDTSPAFREFIVTVKDNPTITGVQFDILWEFIHEHETLRWTPQQFIKGRQWHLGKKITLTEAMETKSVVKIDIVTLINDLFSEVTNMFYLGYINRINELIPINVAHDFTDPKEFAITYLIILRDNIRKLMNPLKGSPKYYKTIKRLWAVSAFMITHGDSSYKRDIDALTPILTGDVAALYQVMSSIEAYLLVVEKIGLTHEYPEFIGKLRYLLASVPSLPLDKLENYMELLDLKTNKAFRKIADSLYTYINEEAHKFMSAKGYLPIPAKFLPSYKS